MSKRYNKDYFLKIREESAKYYESMASLNWGEMIDGNYTINDRYHFDWKIEKITDSKRSLKPLIKDKFEYIDEFLEENKNKKITIYIGTDSQNYMASTRFVSAIVMHVERNGAHVLVSRFDLPKIYDYRYRLLKEVDITGEVARNMKDYLRKKGLSYELHSDLNGSSNHKSNGIVEEAKNYIKHLGYELKIKPEAFAATYAADHFCK